METKTPLNQSANQIIGLLANAKERKEPAFVSPSSLRAPELSLSLMNVPQWAFYLIMNLGVGASLWRVRPAAGYGVTGKWHCSPCLGFTAWRMQLLHPLRAM